MVIDFDTKRFPTGSIAWSGLLAAVLAADPGDENEWIEFKAGVDPATKEGAATLAKGIVAFANRDPDIASRWFDGYGIILVGIQPGSVPGVPPIDPAVLHDKINGLLHDPAPHWDVTPLTYDGKTVIAVHVDPPKPGDRIACISKDSVKVHAGEIYVRKVGKSDYANPADLRRLEDRLSATSSALDGIGISADGDVQVLTFDPDWADRWLAAEGVRLSSSLTRPVTRPPEQPGRYGDFLSVGTLNALLTERDEDRTPAEFQAEADAYLDACRNALPEALDELRATHASSVRFSVTNADAVNYEGLRIEFHLEGDAFGYGYEGDFENVREHLPDPPRQFGHWVENKLANLGRISMPSPIIGRGRSGPTIVNGGSVRVTTDPIHLRPKATEVLDTGLLVANDTVTGPIRVTWTATATNRNAVLHGELMLPITEPLDVGWALRWSTS